MKSVKVKLLLIFVLPTACMELAPLVVNPLAQTMNRSENARARPRIVNKTRKDGVFTRPEDGHDVASMRVVWNAKSEIKRKKMLLKETGKDNFKGLLLLPIVSKKIIESYLAVGLVAPGFGGNAYPPGSLVRFIDEKGKIRQGQLAGSGTRVRLPRRSWLPCIMFDGEEPDVDYEKMLSVKDPPPDAGIIPGRCMSVLCCLSTLCNCCMPLVGSCNEDIPDEGMFERSVGMGAWLVCCFLPFCASCVAGCPYTVLRIALCGCTNDREVIKDPVIETYEGLRNLVVKERCGIPCPCPYPSPHRTHKGMDHYEWSECYRWQFHANARCMWATCSIWYPYTGNFPRPENI